MNPGDVTSVPSNRASPFLRLVCQRSQSQVIMIPVLAELVEAYGVVIETEGEPISVFLESAHPSPSG